jgi:YD repeat-containing protein
MEDELDNQIHYTWDDATYNLMQVHDNHGRRLEFTYDERRNLLSTQDQSGRTTFTEWDAHDNPVATVDTLGRRSATADHGPARTSVRRNAANEVVSATDPLGRTYECRRDRWAASPPPFCRRCGGATASRTCRPLKAG